MNCKYENSKIYRIVCLDTGKYYYGSTTKSIEERLKTHESKYKCYLNDKDSYVSSFEILKNNNYVIELVEEYSCDSKRELEQQEDIYIKECMNDALCVNKQRAYTNDKEKKECKNENSKKYYIKNRVKKIEYMKEYSKMYNIKHRDKYLEYKSEKIECECGSIVRRGGISRHRKTKKHLKLLNKI